MALAVTHYIDLFWSPRGLMPRVFSLGIHAGFDLVETVDGEVQDRSTSTWLSDILDGQLEYPLTEMPNLADVDATQGMLRKGGVRPGPDYSGAENKIDEIRAEALALKDSAEEAARKDPQMDRVQDAVGQYYDALLDWIHEGENGSANPQDAFASIENLLNKMRSLVNGQEDRDDRPVDRAEVEDLRGEVNGKAVRLVEVAQMFSADLEKTDAGVLLLGLRLRLDRACQETVSRSELEEMRRATEKAHQDTVSALLGIAELRFNDTKAMVTTKLNAAREEAERQRLAALEAARRDNEAYAMSAGAASGAEAPEIEELGSLTDLPEEPARDNTVVSGIERDLDALEAKLEAIKGTENVDGLAEAAADLARLDEGSVEARLEC